MPITKMRQPVGVSDVIDMDVSRNANGLVITMRVPDEALPRLHALEKFADSKGNGPVPLATDKVQDFLYFASAQVQLQEIRSMAKKEKSRPQSECIEGHGKGKVVGHSEPVRQSSIPKLASRDSRDMPSPSPSRTAQGSDSEDSSDDRMDENTNANDWKRRRSQEQCKSLLATVRSSKGEFDESPEKPDLDEISPAAERRFKEIEQRLQKVEKVITQGAKQDQARGRQDGRMGTSVDINSDSSTFRHLPPANTSTTSFQTLRINRVFDSNQRDAKIQDFLQHFCPLADPRHAKLPKTPVGWVPLCNQLSSKLQRSRTDSLLVQQPLCVCDVDGNERYINFEFQGGKERLTKLGRFAEASDTARQGILRQGNYKIVKLASTLDGALAVQA